MSKYSNIYRVRSGDAGADGKLKLSALMLMLQEIATEHADILGVGCNLLNSTNMGWVLSKLLIEVDKIPSWGEKIEIKTWASERERIVTYREFEIFSQDGKKLFCARSQWLLFDMATRKINRLCALPAWQSDPQHSTCCDFQAHLHPAKENSFSASCKVRYDDIDLNRHVNNAVYMAWGLEALPHAFLNAHTPKLIEINFLEEVMPNDEIDSLCQLSGEQTMHSIINKRTSRECARINMNWCNII